MSNKNKNKKMNPVRKEVVEEQTPSPTFENGNYVLVVASEGKIIKKLAIANAEIYISKIDGQGMAIDLI